MHVLQAHPVLVIEPPAHIDCGSVRPFRRSYGLALEISRGFDSAVLIDVEGREAKQARADHRQAYDIGLRSRDLGAEFRKRELAHIPFAIERKAREYFVVPEREP